MDIIDILKITLPALLVLLTAYLLLGKLLKNEEKKRAFELRKSGLSTITPIRLRAYERLILVLERTTPTTLILNNAQKGMTNLQLQTQLLASVRQEFGHNLSQQIYISDQTWNYVRAAQQSLLQLINTCAQKCDPNASASDLSELLIQVYGATENTPTELAIEKLKNEVKSFL